MRKINTILILTLMFLCQLIYGQITTTKIAEKKEAVPNTKYDSLQNFLGESVYKYIGQDLYLKGKPDKTKKFGYDGFLLDYTKSITDISNVYKNIDGYNSDYDELQGKYFNVLAIHKHPEAEKFSLLYGTRYYMELKEKKSGDIVFFDYDSKYEHTFPFIVVGFFEKQKKRLVGEKFVLCNKAMEEQIDINTGKPITKNSGQKWECVDLTVDEVYYELSLVLKNSLNEKTTLSYDYSFNEYSKGRVYLAKAADYYKTKFGITNWLKILDNQILVGFTKEMAKLAWGEPDKINSASYGEQWVYDNQYLYFKNGKLTAFN